MFNSPLCFAKYCRMIKRRATGVMEAADAEFVFIKEKLNDQAVWDAIRFARAVRERVAGRSTISDVPFDV